MAYHWSKAEALEVLSVLRGHGGQATTIVIFEEIYRRSRRRLVNNSISSLRKWAEVERGIPRDQAVSCEYVGRTADKKLVYCYRLCAELMNGRRTQAVLFTD